MSIFAGGTKKFPVRVPYQYRVKERGGAFKVNGYVALLLLAAAVTSAAYGYYQHSHRVIEMHITLLPTTKIHASVTDDDMYVTHTFPEGREVCTGYNTICWIRI